MAEIWTTGGMLILGLHKDPWHNSGACAVKERGSHLEVALLSEERLDRVKDSRSFPHHSAQACLREVGATDPNEADLIVLDHIVRSDDWRQDQFKRPCSTANFLDDLDPAKVVIINHHLAHAYAVFHSSHFPEAAVLIVDGRGSEGETQSLFHAGPSGIELIDKTGQIGIGLLYAAVTQAIGFGLLQEGKTMGLAPYGRGVGEPVFDFGGKFSGIVTDYSDFCTDGNYEIRAAHRPILTFEDKARAAFEVQDECESALLHLARHAKERTGARYLCLSGGVGLNSVGNYEILTSGLFDDIFINPAASDTGIPLGCALYGYYSQGGMLKPEISPYLGPSYPPLKIEQAIARYSGYRVFRANARHLACRLLAANRIVGRFEGRSEMGPRALGHRSILMSRSRPRTRMFSMRG